MRNKIGGMIREIENEIEFCLYEINDSYDHNHKIVWNQTIQLKEITGLKNDLLKIVENIEEYEQFKTVMT